MDHNASEETFMVWGPDHTVYGPVDLPTMIDWAKDERVLPKTWVLARGQNRWRYAEMIEPLHEFFVNNSILMSQPPSAVPDAAALAEELRQFSIFSRLSDEQLEQFIQFGELVEAPRGCLLIKRNEQSDSLFFLLSGEVRARLVIGHDDKTLCHMKAGECFGEMAMFTQTPRSAELLVETDARLLRLTSEACLLMMNQLPQIAAPILYGMARMMASRIAGGNVQFQREVASEFLWR